MSLFSFLLLLLSILVLNLANAEIIQQCNCKKYEQCLEKAEEPQNFHQCIEKCDAILPSSDVVPCLTIFDEDFEELKDCGYTINAGLKGCSNRKRNIVNRRSTADFRDLMIRAFEVNLKDFDETRRFKNPKAAKQGECIFECIYPGRNSCTKQLECDLLMPSEKELFSTFYKCANQRNFFQKADLMYKCLSRLFVTDSSMIQKDNKTLKRH